MRLSLKITFFLFLMTTLFIAALTAYFIHQINQNFRSQADRLLQQSVAITQQRIQFYREQLTADVNSSAQSLFMENENILAAMLTDPPAYNAEVINFAEKLRKRTTLDFLSVISSSGVFLSDSSEPERFGKSDPLADLPVQEVVFAQEPEPSMQFKAQQKFGRHALYLRGGYFLAKRMNQAPAGGLNVLYLEHPASDQQQTDPSFLQHTIAFHDYLGKPVAHISVSVSQQELLKQRENIVRNSLNLLAGSLLLCLLIGWMLSVGISHPLNKLTAAAQEMTSGNYDVRVPQTGSGEVARLIQAFNTLSQELEESRQRLIQTERIAAWNEIAKHLAHEIKNPLTPIRTSIMNLKIAMERAPEQFPEIFRESSVSIIEEVEALRRLADEFAKFARLPSPQKEIHQVNEIVQKALSLYRTGIPENIALHYAPGEVPSFSFDASQLTQVIHNLLQNSIEACNGSGEIRISTSTAEHPERRWALIAFQDTGSGMTEQIQKQAFTPYFTTKQKGTGLGLAIVHRIVSEHGGNILVESEPGKGTRFEVRLPINS